MSVADFTDPAGDHHRRSLEAGRECLDAALRYALDFNLSVLPCCPPDHVGVRRAHAERCMSPGKAPLVPWKAFQTRRPSEQEIRDW